MLFKKNISVQSTCGRNFQSAVMSYSNFHFADHSIGLSKTECVAKMKLFMLVFGGPSP